MGVIKPAVAKTKKIAYKDNLEFYHGKPCKKCKRTIRALYSGKC